VAKERERHLHHVVARARAIQQRTEQHEDEDVANRHAERNAEHAFGRQPLVRQHALERGALMRDHVGQIAPEHDVGEEDDREDGHRQSDRAPGGLQQQYDADRRNDDVLQDRPPRPRREVIVEKQEVRPGERRGKREDPVEPRNALALALHEREAQEREQQADAEVQRPRFRVVQDREPELEGKRRRVPQLEQRPRDRHREDELARDAAGGAPPGIRVGD
jgi:hypothetical protein